jgi:hypothetical protein
MKANKWETVRVKKFIDKFGTTFTRVTENNVEYDFKLEDGFGEDYCTLEQMELWDIQIKTILEQ